ncbi:hypothetical protein BCR32DRAFT_290008 [Anaeromyces robustus]|uniref:Mediator of RNA polymerase II transcription subunit 9 n=1 Tax=Anaeromyces robustus TaxID=1754192 RepID=A0A1Y1XLP6_9FUNG|nr:hypothetical protein BCR32DRAFT_290008 [Anaeromyces robustus]|eukprot:ORX86426.1 hypothetical protein BCR32DRAFT_290008 [Anaeromyces robustus]
MSKQNINNTNNIINKEEFSFLPTILSIFEKLNSEEFDSHNSEEIKDAQNIKKISMNLLENIEACKAKINNLPGIENSNIEQLNKYDEEIKVVNQRRKQFIQYLNMPIFKKFYNESDIKKQNELISIQERLEAKDKEKINEIKKRNNQDVNDMEIDNVIKKIKTEPDNPQIQAIKKEELIF